MFYIMIFRIESEMKAGDFVFQEIDKRYLKTFDSYLLATDYLHSIENRKLMYNYPWAVIGEYKNQDKPKILSQKIFKYYPTNNDYLECCGTSELSPSTLTMLHPFEGNVLFASDMV